MIVNNEFERMWKWWQLILL